MAERAALVTGGSSGIGLAIARVLGEDGYGVTVSARRPDKLENAVAGLEADGLDVQAVPANVADEEEITKLLRDEGPTTNITFKEDELNKLFGR